MLFALPGDGSDDPGFENPETPASPIDSQIFILAVVGILFAVYIFRNNRKTI